MKISPQIITFDTEDIYEMVDWFMKDKNYEVLSIEVDPLKIINGIKVEVENKSNW